MTDTPETTQKTPVRRKTWQKQAVREALSSSGRFMSAQSLHAAIERSGTKIGLATVYRALSALAEQGEADSLHSGEEVLYRLCEMDGHHHHLICRMCGRAEEIQAEPVEAWANEVARKNGFIEPHHVVDVFGVCPDCAAECD